MFVRVWRSQEWPSQGLQATFLPRFTSDGDVASGGVELDWLPVPFAADAFHFGSGAPDVESVARWADFYPIVWVVLDEFLCGRRERLVRCDAVVEVYAADALPKDEADALVGISGFCVACPRFGVCAACCVPVRGVDGAFVWVPVDPTCCFEHGCWYAAAVCCYFACSAAVDGVFSG